MSKRLQIVLDDEELARIREVAEAKHLTVAEWVRQALRAARQQAPVYDIEKKLQVVREAAGHTYPTADVDDMLDEISRGQSFDRGFDGTPGISRLS